MLAYFFILGVVALFSLAVNNEGELSGVRRVKIDNTIAITIISFTLIFFAGVRYHVGADFNNYIRFFANRQSITFEQIINGIFHFEEPGFDLVCLVSAKINNSYTTMFTIASFLTIFPSMLVIFKNSNWYRFSMILYVLLVYTGTFGAIRQCLAATIVFCGIKYLVNRNFLKYMLVVVFASMFHTTALIMLPVYFLVTKKASWRNAGFMLILALFLRYSYDFIFDLIGAYKGGDLGNYSYLTSSVNTFRVLVACAPLLILFIADKSELTPRLNLAINFVILHAALSLATSNSTYLARANIYTTTFLVLALPELVNRVNVQYKKMLMIVIVFLYGLYWWYGIVAQDLRYDWIFSI